MPGVDTGARPKAEGKQKLNGAGHEYSASRLLSSQVLQPLQWVSNHRSYNSRSPQRITKLEISHSSEAVKKADVRSYQVTMQLRDGKTEKLLHDIEVRPNQDVLDLLIYTVVEGQVKFALSYTARPTLRTRTDAAQTQEGRSGFLWSLPGAYIDPNNNGDLFSTANFITFEKLGLIPAEGSPLEFLGGAMFSSPRESTELRHIRALRVQNIPERGVVEYGEGLKCQRITGFFSLDEIITSIQNGKIKDLRIIDAVLSFSRAHSELVPNAMRKINSIALSESKKSAAIESKILTRSQVRELLGSPSALPAGVESMTLEPLGARRSAGYLCARRYQAEPITKDGSRKQKFGFDSVTKSPAIADSFDCAALCRIAGEDYVLIREAVRPAIKARELAAHAIAGTFPVTHFEGIGGVCSEGVKPTELTHKVASYLSNNFGVTLAPNSRPQEIFAGYPSAGFNPQLTHLMVCAVDPSTGIDKWDPSLKLIKVRDLLKLGAEGSIRDLRLISAVKLLLPNLNVGRTKHDKQQTELRSRYLSLLDQGSEIHAWLSKDDGRRSCAAALGNDRRFRLLLCLAENEMGLVMGVMNHPEEGSFFSPTLPLYPLMVHKRGSKVAVLHFAHDLRHYIIGDYIPSAPPSDPRLAKKHFKDFLKMYHENEVIAGWYSDYVLPSVLGLKESRKLLGRHSLFEMFNAYGITDKSEAKRIYRLMERDGIIDAKLLADRNLYKRFKNTIIQATLYARVMFRSHAKAVYKNWIEHPKTAKIAAEFSDRSFQDIAKQMKIFEGSAEEIKKYPEGVNPLRAALSRTIVSDIQLQVMRLAYYAEVLQKRDLGAGDVCEAAFKKIADVKKIYQELLAMRKQVSNVEASKQNLTVFKRLEELKHEDGPLAELKSFVDRFEARHLPADLQSEVKGRLVPFYKKLPFVEPRKIQGRIAALERKSFRKADRRHELVASRA